MTKIFLSLFLASILLVSCTKEFGSSITGTGETLNQNTPPPELTPSVPEATVTKTPATPMETESGNADSVTPESPASDVVTPIGTPE